VGKTRLAEEAARGLVEQYADGVWLVDLAPVTDAGRLSDAVAEAMGLDPAAGVDPVRVLAARLVARQVLLLFDNCEHVLDACARLIKRLLPECPGLRVLTTSREPLHVPGEVILRVPSLGVPDAAEGVEDALGRESVRLFVERALDVRPGFRLDEVTVAPVVEICRRLDGVPLAIELAAARLAHLTPAEIAERLGNALTVLGGGGRMTRHATLRAALQWSHGMLTEPEQVLLRRLSVFAGGFTLAAAEGVCSAEPLAPETILDCLGRLVDKSMVLAEPTGQRSRFRLLETIRQFGREQLSAAGEESAVRAAHFKYYLRLAVDHDPDRRRDVVEARPQLLDEEHDNLRAALGRALRTEPDQALLLAVSLWRFWLSRGHFVEGSRWLEETLAAASADCGAERSRGLLALALLDARLGRVSRFSELGEKAIAVAPKEAAAFTRVLAGFLEPVRGNVTAALAAADKGMAEEAPEVVAAAYWLRSVIELSREETSEALKFLHDTLAAVERVPAEAAPFLPVVTATIVLVPCAGRWVPAFEETALIGRRVGRAQAVGHIWSAIGSAYRIDRDLPMAAGAVRHAVEVFSRLGDDAGRAFALQQLGCIERDLRSYADARAHLGEALRLRRQLGDRRGENLTLANLGLTEAAAGEIEAGRRLAGAALRRSQEIEDGPGTGGGLLDLAVLELFAEDKDRSRELAGQAVEALRPQGYPKLTGWALAFAAELAADQADQADKANKAREAATLFTEAGCRIGLAKTTELLAKAR
jgi:predicted ATPase